MPGRTPPVRPFCIAAPNRIGGRLKFLALLKTRWHNIHMDSLPLMPLLLNPIYKEYVWGGERFIDEFHRRLHPGVYAESWEVADHPDGHTDLLNGPLAGHSLQTLIKAMGENLLGKGRTDSCFPLMVKLIDARETLSVQVHPDDRAAAQYGGEAKSEMWYVLSATPDAHIYSGFKPGVTREKFIDAQRTGTIPTLLQSFPARSGMIFSTPGGRVHAIGAGCLLLEVQQDANTTYRLYDWDRKPSGGVERPLHIEQALQVINWDMVENPIATPQPLAGCGDGFSGRLLLETPHFHVEEWTISKAVEIDHDNRSFLILFPLNTDARIRARKQPAMILKQSTTCLLPAALGPFTAQPAEAGNTLKMLAIRQP